ncbi:MAG: DoxX family protein [Porticoccaceae bacterium]|nr:DoxX family protein [Porticoccaceae bacterium]MDG1474190.1 DoxX family protein [Porticoccaceae bacterium]
MNQIFKIYIQINELLRQFTNVVALLIRFWMAKIFLLAGLTKIDNWDSTLMLFEYEYTVPFISVAMAAFLATFFELVMPILLFVGLFTRLAAIPLLVMTAVIEFTYGSFPEHAYWALLLGLLVTYGAGRYSADHYFVDPWLSRS